jgi:hypothetical protein
MRIVAVTVCGKYDLWRNARPRAGTYRPTMGSIISLTLGQDRKTIGTQTLATGR